MTASRLSKTVYRLLLVNLVLELLTSLECGSLRSSDLDCLACSGVSSLASSALLNRECTEAYENNLLVVSKCIGDSIESSLESSLRILLGKSSVLCDCINKFCFIHCIASY